MPLSTVPVCIITQSHLSNNPRVLKEAILLSQNGYTVYIITSLFSQKLLQQDLAAIQDYPIKLCILTDNSKRNIKSLINRAIYKMGRFLIKYFKFETSWALGYGAHSYYKKAKSINAGLYICHQELATYIGNKLLRSGYQVAFDLEDWYSEDLLPQARNKRPLKLLRNAESFALNNGVFCTTTSKVLAQKLSQIYLCPKPEVIYNIFPSRKNIPEKLKDLSKPVKLFWFSQTIGAGRGVEQFIRLTASFKTKFELHLLGNIDIHYREKLNTLIAAQHQLYFHELVEPDKLAEKIADFDIGLALEQIEPQSRNYTITNKFFQYIQSGIPVIISETAGQNEGFEKFKPGFKLSQSPTNNEILELDKWLNDPLELQLAKERAIEASRFYNWEIESKKLLALVNKAYKNTIA